jgi:uncharacterized protein
VGRPITLDAVACDFPELKLIGIHVGIPWHDEMIAMSLEARERLHRLRRPQPEVLAAVVHPLHQHLRPLKVIFGTDYPGARLRAHGRRKIAALEPQARGAPAVPARATRMRVFKLQA